MYDIFVTIIDLNCSTSASRERQCSMLHARDECLTKTWSDFIADKELLTRTRDMLLQYAIDKVLKSA